MNERFTHNYGSTCSHAVNDVNLNVIVNDRLSGAGELKIIGDCGSRKEDFSSALECGEENNIPNTPVKTVKEETKISDQTEPVPTSSPSTPPTKPIPPVRSASRIQTTRDLTNRRKSLPVSIPSTVESDASVIPGNDCRVAGSLRRGSTLPSVKPMIALKPKLLGNKPSASTSKSDAVIKCGKEEIIPVSRPPRAKKGPVSSSNPILPCEKPPSSVVPLNESVSNGRETDKKSCNVIRESFDCMHEIVPASQETASDSNDSYLKVAQGNNKELEHVSSTDSPSVKSEPRFAEKTSLTQIAFLSLKGDSCPSSETYASTKSNVILECAGKESHTESSQSRQISGSNSPSTLTETTPANVIQDLVTFSVAATPEQPEKHSTPDSALEQKRIPTSSSASSAASDEHFPLITGKSQAASSITSTTNTMTPLPTQTVSSTISQPVPAPRRTTPSTHLPSSHQTPALLPPSTDTKLSACQTSSRAPSVPNGSNSSCMIFDFRGKDVKPSLAISSPFGRSAVISKDEEDGEDYRGSMEVPPPSGLVFIGENEVIGKGSLLKNRNKKVS